MASFSRAEGVLRMEICPFLTDTVPVKWFARSIDQSEIVDKTGIFYFIISCVLSFSSLQKNENCVMTRESRVLF